MISIRDAECSRMGIASNSERTAAQCGDRGAIVRAALACVNDFVGETVSSRRWNLADFRWKWGTSILLVESRLLGALQRRPRAAQCGGEEGTLDEALEGMAMIVGARGLWRACCE
jgi:hypothetical protein